jgi:hypothetical protein
MTTLPKENLILPSIRWFAPMLLIVLPMIILPTGDLAVAQDRMVHDRIPNGMPSEMRNEIEPAGAYTPALKAAAPAPAVPVPHRVIDKKFIFVMGALGGAESLRFTSRKLVLDREFAAGAPWVTSLPANQHLIAEYAGIYASELFVAYEMKKPHSWLPGDKIIRKLWWACPTAMAAIHVKNAVGNIRTQGPGGCTSIECAEQMQ